MPETRLLDKQIVEDGYEKTWVLNQALKSLPEPRDYDREHIKILVPYDVCVKLLGHYEAWFVKTWWLMENGKKERVWAPGTVYWKEM